jgi:hypothetical protein
MPPSFSSFGSSQTTASAVVRREATPAASVRAVLTTYGQSKDLIKVKNKIFEGEGAEKTIK